VILIQTTYDFHTSEKSAYNGDLFLIKRKPIGGMCALDGDFTGHVLTVELGQFQ
jgi:hypothetical protein